MKPSNRLATTIIVAGAVLIPLERNAFWKMRDKVIDFSHRGSLFFCPESVTSRPAVHP